MPYIGYWQLMAAVDVYVVYDDVNYIKGGWVSRNRILMDGKPHLFTITLNGASPNKLFNEIEVRDNFVKFRKMLQSCYAKAPYFADTMQLMEQVYSYEQRDLGHFMLNQFQMVLDYLQCDTKLILSSELTKDNTLRGAEKVKHICKLLGADTYYNAIGGRELYDKSDFAVQGVDLKFVQTLSVQYKQFNDDFQPNLSLIDVLMFNSREEVQQLLNQYKLV
ncbi:MAG: WbqC family protein [Bacteroidales bacterium]|nr:WbqC family protein [Bacteroidales bacterium]